MKVNRKQDLNVLYQVCVFWTDRKNKMAPLASDRLRHFQLLLWNHLIKFNENWTGSKISTSSTMFVFFGPIGKTRWPPWLLICWDFFNLVAHCPQVHDMWPFGPLVYIKTKIVVCSLHILYLYFCGLFCNNPYTCTGLLFTYNSITWSFLGNSLVNPARTMKW